MGTLISMIPILGTGIATLLSCFVILRNYVDQTTNRVTGAPGRSKRLYALISAVFLGSALSGCGTLEDKCGLSECPGDARITANVQSRLDRRPDLGPPGQIAVQTISGVVYLNGVVDNGLEKEIAQSVAQGTPGVKDVVSSIEASK